MSKSPNVRSTQEINDAIGKPLHTNPQVVGISLMKGFEPTIAALPATTFVGLNAEKSSNLAPCAFLIGWRINNENLELLMNAAQQEEKPENLKKSGRITLFHQTEEASMEYKLSGEITEKELYANESMLFTFLVNMNGVDEIHLLMLKNCLQSLQISKKRRNDCLAIYENPEEQAKRTKITRVALGVIALIAGLGVVSYSETGKRQQETCTALAKGEVPRQLSDQQKFFSGHDVAHIAQTFTDQAQHCQAKAGITLIPGSTSENAHRQWVERTLQTEGKLLKRR